MTKKLISYDSSSVYIITLTEAIFYPLFSQARVILQLTELRLQADDVSDKIKELYSTKLFSP